MCGCIKNKNFLPFIFIFGFSVLGGLLLTLWQVEESPMSISRSYLPLYEQPVPYASSDLDENLDSLSLQLDEEEMFFEDEISDLDKFDLDSNELDLLERSYVKSEF